MIALIALVPLVACPACGGTDARRDVGQANDDGGPPAPDGELDPCPPPTTGKALSFEPYTPPGPCALSPALPVTLTVVDSEAAFGQFFDCNPADTPSGVDFGAARVAIVAVMENPNVAVLWVNEGDTAVTVGVRVQAYCGGARPPDAYVPILLPAGAKPIKQQLCNVGDCGECPPLCPP